ncbi:MAG TPA: polynucleotide adenylyltransferase [Verrucomicrobiae bacterium]|nr:polynucleotide adenylyltransferase [Verrucomicrobiae bacterium]
MNFIPAELDRILRETPVLRRSFLVGGCVRDALLARPPGPDFDVEVFGVGYEALAAGLAAWGKTDLVGRSFGVVKLSIGGAFTYDFTIPRRDSKIAPGHKGFAVEFDPDITPEQAASRRDFTINSLMYDPREHWLLDFFGGQADLEHRILRHTSAAFGEDPLRVLRGMQFAARFNLTPAPETIELARRIKSSYAQLPVERVREEWCKWARLSVTPSLGLKFLRDTEWIDHFPELKATIGVPQEPEWHPEGDVFVHTCHCCDAMVQLQDWQTADSDTRVALMLGILTHDFGKPATTHQALRHGAMRIVSPGHEEAGEPVARAFLQRIGVPIAMENRVAPLVRNHLIHFQDVSDRLIRRLAKRLEPESIEHLCLIITADSNGRPPRPPSEPENVKKLLARAHELQVRHQPAPPILMGRHLLELGLAPGREFRVMLDAAYEAQLEGVFFDLTQARRWLAEQEGLPLAADIRERLLIGQKVQQ